MAINTTFVSGNILTAAQMNNLPWGVAGYATKATSQTVTAEADVTGLTATWTAVGGRVYKFTIMMTINAGATANEVTVFLNDGTTNIKETIMSQVNGEYHERSIVFYVTGITAGSKTYKVRASGNSSQIYGTSTRASLAAQFIIEDIGAA